MCTGEVDRKVWMRLRAAGLTASAQRSMSLKAARASPHDRVLGALGDLVHGGEIALRGDRKAGLDDVDAHLVEQLGDLELLLVGHGGARALLAVAQGGVEDDDAVLLGLRWRGHDVILSSWLAPLLGRSWVSDRDPLSAQAQTPSRPSGEGKEQEPAENEGAAGGGLGPPGHRADIAARRHHVSPSSWPRRIAIGKTRSQRDRRVLAEELPVSQDRIAGRVTTSTQPR